MKLSQYSLFEATFHEPACVLDEIVKSHKIPIIQYPYGGNDQIWELLLTTPTAEIRTQSNNLYDYTEDERLAISDFFDMPISSSMIVHFLWYFSQKEYNPRESDMYSCCQLYSFCIRENITNCSSRKAMVYMLNLKHEYLPLVEDISCMNDDQIEQLRTVFTMWADVPEEEEPEEGDFPPVSLETRDAIIQMKYYLNEKMTPQTSYFVSFIDMIEQGSHGEIVQGVPIVDMIDNDIFDLQILKNRGQKYLEIINNEIPKS